MPRGPSTAPPYCSQSCIQTCGRRRSRCSCSAWAWDSSPCGRTASWVRSSYTRCSTGLGVCNRFINNTASRKQVNSPPARPETHEGYIYRLLSNDVHPVTLTVERHYAVRQREQRVVLTRADVPPRLITGAALADDNTAGADTLATIHLDTQALTVRLPTIPDRTLTFLMSHYFLPVVVGSGCRGA